MAEVQAAAASIQENNVYTPVVSEEEMRRTPQHGPGAKPLPEHTRLEDQNFGVIALLSNTSQKAARRVMVSFRGTFPTQDSAEAYIERVLHPADPDVDHFVIALWQWGMLPPSKTHVMQMDTKYHDPEVERYMQGYFDSIKRDRENLELRRKKAMKKAKADSTQKRLDANARRELQSAIRRNRSKPVWTPQDDKDRVKEEDSSKLEEID